MADINKVRKGLECCTGLGCHHGCEYLKKGCTQFLKMDALELINKQQAEIEHQNELLTDLQPLKPIYGKTVHGASKDLCRNCRKKISTSWFYCAYCGQPIGWEIGIVGEVKQSDHPWKEDGERK